MLLRLVVILLCGLVTTSVEACPKLQTKAASDCCHKKCPRPVQVQPCFDCVADVRVSATAPEQVMPAEAPSLESSAILTEPVTLRTSRDLIPDHSYTYLRIGVFRI